MQRRSCVLGVLLRNSGRVSARWEGWDSRNQTNGNPWPRGAGVFPASVFVRDASRRGTFAVGAASSRFATLLPAEEDATFGAGGPGWFYSFLHNFTLDTPVSVRRITSQAEVTRR